MFVDILASSFTTHPGAPAPADADGTQAAVAVIIRPDEHVLFIRRAEHPDDPWSGHIALPGGRMDPGDLNLQATAIREVAEEVGVVLDGARCLGMLQSVSTPAGVPAVEVLPYVFSLDVDPPLQLDPGEVAAVHWLDLHRLIGGEGRGTFPYCYQGTHHLLPRVDMDGARLWGITLRIIDDLLGRLEATP